MKAWKFNTIFRRIWLIPFAVIFTVLGMFWIIRIGPVNRFFGLERRIVIPLCTCVEGYEPGDGSPADQEIDLDPSTDPGSKPGEFLVKQNGERILVWYSTQEQLYEYLTRLEPGNCIATSARPWCLSGRVVVTETVNGTSVSHNTGGPNCEFATPVPIQWITPVVEVFNCFMTSIPDN